MVDRDTEREQDAGVLRRWSRRKQGTSGPAATKESASTNNDSPEQTLQDPALRAEVAPLEPLTEAAEDEAVQDEGAEPLLTDEDMPAIESIGKDSDVSCFFNRGVSEQLRQQALRHLLRLPAFNITDGLNDYDEDYTTFAPLGDIVTSDMKFHARRKEKLAAQKREEEEALASQEAEEPETDEAETAQDANAIESAEEAPDTNEQEELAAEPGSVENDARQVGASSDNNVIRQESQLTAEDITHEAPVPESKNSGDLA